MQLFPLSLSRVYSAMLTHTLGCYQSCKTGSDVIDPAASLFCARLSSFEDVRRVIAPGLSLNVIRENVYVLAEYYFTKELRESAFRLKNCRVLLEFIKNDIT